MRQLNITIVFLILFSVIVILVYLLLKPPKQAKIKPCNCLSLSDMMLYAEKYAMYTDSLEYAPKKQRERLTDSLVFYYNALRVNENPINIEK